MERPLCTPAFKPLLADLAVLAGADDIDTQALFEQVVVDRARLAGVIRLALRTRAQITLRELLAHAPLQHGLAELVAYLQLGHGRGELTEGFSALVDEAVQETIQWQASAADGAAVTRAAKLPRVIYTR
ncbi:MAG: DUF3375 family protein [Rhodocyclaceae bacterium]|nr:DUF3375 family protein [Rhodocyclaceae bacterium]